VIVPLARRALRSLAREAARRPDRLSVAILTGRAALDVASRVRVGGIEYFGDHGLQSGSFPRGARFTSVEVVHEPGHEASAAARFAAEVPARLGRPPWLFIERKGPSVAFHVRQAEDLAAARAAVEDAIAAVDRELPPHDLAHYRGRLVVDLRPTNAGGKREAVLGLLARTRPAAVLLLGDDVSDADAFAVLLEAREAGSTDGLAVAVTGPHGVPPEVAEVADTVLATPFEAARLLAAVARAIRAESSGA
jgi:trehalose 6-phosphate phosphatase